MKHSSYIYNNEAVSFVAIYSILKEMRSINIAILTLVLPFLLHEKTLNFLHDTDIKSLSLKEFANSNFLLFTNLNERFLIFLPICANVVSILCSTNLAQIQDNQLVINPDNEFEFTGFDIGSRGERLITGAEKLANLLNKNVTELFHQLRIFL